MRCAWCPRPAGPAPLCDRHLDAAGHDIGALRVDFRELGEVRPEQGAPGQRVSGTRAPSVPIDLLADELRRSIVWALGVWEPPVREALGLAPADEAGVPPERFVDRAASLLSGHVGTLCALPPTWGYPLGIEAGCVARRGLYGAVTFRRLHSRSLVALGLVGEVLHLPGTCPACGAAALTGAAGIPVITCAHCHHRIPSDEYLAGLGMTSSPDRVKSAPEPGGPAIGT